MRHHPSTIDLIVVHHSASDPLKTDTDTIRQWHMAKGWNDIGYHRVIEADGIVMDGRPVQRVGAHAPPNAGRLGVVLCGWNGNASHPEWAWNLSQWDSLVDELVYWLRRLPDARVCGHNQTKATLCPGLDLYHELDKAHFSFQRRVIDGPLID